jgi:Tol biopolymer transport system component
MASSSTKTLLIFLYTFIFCAAINDEICITGDDMGDSWHPTWSPDGKRLAFVSGEDYYATDIWIKALDGGPAINLTNDPDRDYDPVWSPDGKYIAYESSYQASPAIRIVDVATGEKTYLTDGYNSFCEMPCWSPDSQWVAYMKETWTGNDIVKTCVTDSTTINLTNDDNTNEHPTWSKDGTVLAFEAHGGLGLSFIPAKGGPAKHLCLIFLDYPNWSPTNAYIIGGGTNLVKYMFCTEALDYITTGNRQYFNPEESPDGTNIAFDRLGEIWLLHGPSHLIVPSTLGKIKANYR